MKFEVAYLGRPAILLAAADDQLRVGPAFAATGAAIYLGDGRSVDPDVVVGAIRTLLADEPGRARMSAIGRELVDGDGSTRTAARIASLARSLTR
jgi:spore coat polysaccharide biosynthesis predicted glycosyltransferase SpsG